VSDCALVEDDNNLSRLNNEQPCTDDERYICTIAFP